MNAVEIEADLAGRLFVHGQGAGSLPSTSAVVGDLIQVARDIGQHRPAEPRRFRANSLALLPISDLQTRYYLRLRATDGTDIPSMAAAVLSEFGIRIDSALTEPNGEQAELVLTTHTAHESSLQSALAALHGLDAMGSIQMLRIEDLAPA